MGSLGETQPVLNNLVLLRRLPSQIFEGFVAQLLRSHFYITDSEPYKHALLYYRKVAWARLSAAGVTEVRSALGLEPMAQSAVARAVCSTRLAGGFCVGAGGSLGVAAIRLLPKVSGMRPIADLSRKRKSMRSAAMTSPNPVALRGLRDAVVSPSAGVLSASPLHSSIPNVSINSLLHVVHDVRLRMCSRAGNCPYRR